MVPYGSSIWMLCSCKKLRKSSVREDELRVLGSFWKSKGNSSHPLGLKGYSDGLRLKEVQLQNDFVWILS